MTINLSTNLRNGMLGTVGFTTAFTNGVIYVYSGPQPLNADAAVQGTLLLIITKASGAFTFGTSTNGLNFASPSGGVVSKDGNTWSGLGLANGTAGWARLMGNAVDNLAADSSFLLPRMDFACATVGGDLDMGDINIQTGLPTSINVWQFTLPQS